MAHVNTSIMTEGGGGLIGNLASAASSIIGAIKGQRARPGGAPIMASGLMAPAVGGALRNIGIGAGLGAVGSMIDVPFIDIVKQGAGAQAGGACPTTPFAPASRGMRAQTHIQLDPQTGRAVWFKPAGRPILWSGDLTATKRVRKVATRARRSRGGR